MSFNFTEYQVYSQSKGESKASVAITAQGVLAYVRNVYQISLEETVGATITTPVTAGDTEYVFDVFPVTAVTEVFDSSGIPIPYTYSNLVITFDEAIEDDDIITISYDSISTPQYSDLKIAIYKHIDASVFAATNHTDSVDRVVNSGGNTTFFVNNTVPPASREVYEYYSPRTVALF